MSRWHFRSAGWPEDVAREGSHGHYCQEGQLPKWTLLRQTPSRQNANSSTASHERFPILTEEIVASMLSKYWLPQSSTSAHRRCKSSLVAKRPSEGNEVAIERTESVLSWWEPVPVWQSVLRSMWWSAASTGRSDVEQPEFLLRRSDCLVTQIFSAVSPRMSRMLRYSKGYRGELRLVCVMALGPGGWKSSTVQDRTQSDLWFRSSKSGPPAAGCQAMLSTKRGPESNNGNNHARGGAPRD